MNVPLWVKVLRMPQHFTSTLKLLVKQTKHGPSPLSLTTVNVSYLFVYLYI